MESNKIISIMTFLEWDVAPSTIPISFILDSEFDHPSPGPSLILQNNLAKMCCLVRPT